MIEGVSSQLDKVSNEKLHGMACIALGTSLKRRNERWNSILDHTWRAKEDMTEGEVECIPSEGSASPCVHNTGKMHGSIQRQSTLCMLAYAHARAGRCVAAKQ